MNNSAPPKRPPSAPQPTPKPMPSGSVRLGTIAEGAGQRIIVYGTGGIGKTTLSILAPGSVAVFDYDDSLPRLKNGLDDGGLGLSIHPVEGAGTWQTMRDALLAPGWDDIKTIVIDSITRAEELAIAHTLKTVPHEKGGTVNSIEGYGFGKGYQHVYETFLTLLNDLDRHKNAGRNVILVAHECTADVPNPQGDDWIRYEPRLQSPKSGKSSIRLRVKEWADHVLFIGYDVNVEKGKAQGSGTRTIYPTETPHCMAKSRSMDTPYPLRKFDTDFWAKLLK